MALIKIVTGVDPTHGNDSEEATWPPAKVDIELRRFPYPAYSSGYFFKLLYDAESPFLLLNVISLFYPILSSMRLVLKEKRSGMKETMQLMGARASVYWLAWFVQTFATLVPGLVAHTCSFAYQTHTSNTAGRVLYQCETLVFCAVMALFLSNAIAFALLLAAACLDKNVASMLFFVEMIVTYFSLSFLPTIFVGVVTDSWLNIAFSYLFNFGISYAIQTLTSIVRFGANDTHDPFDVLVIFVCQLASIGAKALLVAYFEQLNLGGRGGRRRSWLFPIQSVLVLLFRRRPPPSAHADDTANNNKTYFEEDDPEQADKRVIIRFDRVTKSYTHFGATSQAVKCLSLDVYEGQITVLLGHNGAGKSTTMSMISGLVNPTSGRVVINGKHVAYSSSSSLSSFSAADAAAVQDGSRLLSHVGYCPQHNILFDGLSVMEHMRLFAALKSGRICRTKKEIAAVLETLRLDTQHDTLVGKLSSGARRKLSVAIAFVANDNIVVLDEPCKCPCHFGTYSKMCIVELNNQIK